MKKSGYFLLLILFSIVLAVGAAAEGKVSFEPVRAPSKGPDDAAVTVIEIADFM